MRTRSIYEHKELLATMSIEVSKLGCVMLPVEPFDIFGEGRDQYLNPADLYVADDPNLWWVNGDVTDKSHITLLHGLLTPAYEQQAAVDAVLATWDCLDYFAPERVTFFPSPEGVTPAYAAIVVEIEDSGLEEAHARLSYLPHVNTFPQYRSHMTLCYVRADAAQHWMDVLNEAQFHIYVKAGGLDYGEDK